MSTPTDKPADALTAYAHARRVVTVHLGSKGFIEGALFERVVDVVALWALRHGTASAAKEVPGIALEQARWRLNRLEDELGAYRALGGSRGRLPDEIPSKGDA
jgi:hypothetical protein